MESDQLFDCTVNRRQLMGQTVYKSVVGYRSFLLYLFQQKYNYKSAFVMSNTFQLTFQRLVDANTVLQSGTPPLLTLHHRSRNKDNPGHNLLLEEPPTCRTLLLQGWQVADGR